MLTVKNERAGDVSVIKSSTITREHFSTSIALFRIVSCPRTIRPAHLMTDTSPARSFFTVSMTGSCQRLLLVEGYVYRRREVPIVIKSFVKAPLILDRGRVDAANVY